jgi:hypothetical protein
MTTVVVAGAVAGAAGGAAGAASQYLTMQAIGHAGAILNDHAAPTFSFQELATQTAYGGLFGGLFGGPLAGAGRVLAPALARLGSSIFSRLPASIQGRLNSVGACLTRPVFQCPGSAPVRGPLFQNPSQVVTTRVGELRGAIPTAQQGRITMGVAVVEDANGVRSVLVSSSEARGLRPGVTLQPGEILVRGTGHAEANIIAHAQANNLRVVDIGATRPVCVPCQDAINPTGANISTPLRPRPGN